MIEPGTRPTLLPLSAVPDDRPKRRRRRAPKRVFARGDRHAFRPSNNVFAVERLEARQLLTSDLTSQIGNLIASQSNGTYDLGSVSLGSFLNSPDVSVTLSGVAQQADGGWSGSVTVDAASATLGIGTVTGSITGATQGANGLTGSYTLSDQALDHGSYQLEAGQISATVPGVLKAGSTAVEVDYNPSDPAGQTIATLNSATATLIPFNNATLTLSKLAIRDNGFTLGDATLNGGPITLGNVVSVTGPSVTFANVAYTTGSTLTGSITAGAASATLFPGNATLSASVTNFKGTYTLGTNALAIHADSAEVAVGKIFDAQATNIGLTWDGTNATVDLNTATLTSPLLPGASASLSDFHGDNTGFTIGQADLKAPEIKLGGVLDIKGLDLGVTGLSYNTTTKALGGTFSISTSSAPDAVTILPRSTAFTTSVGGFGATYNVTADALAVKADSATITVGSSLVVTANALVFTLTPTTDPTTGVKGDNVFVTVGSATASLPQVGVSGTITGLTITNDGFHLDSASLSATDLTKPFSAFGGKFKIVNPSVSLTDFGYSIKTGASFNSDLKLSATEIDFKPTTTVSIAAIDLTATISFTTTNVGHFTFSAGTVDAQIGTYLTLTGSKIAFDSAPAAGGYIAQFGSLTAEVKAGSLDVNGSGQNFAIDANGSFVTQAGFGVSLSLSDSKQIQWPSWLPIQVTNLGITWANFQTDPTDFTLDLSASINAKLGSTGISLSGTVTDAIIDVGLLQQKKFPITGLSGAGIGVSGNLFGAVVTGAAFFNILDVDSSGSATTDPTKTVSRIFYGGIEGGIAFDGAAGFQIRLGVSSLGPLDAFLEVDVPILLDPESGLAVTGLYGSIDFNRTLKTETDPKQLASDSDLTPPTQLSLAAWESQLATQVASQAKNVAAGMNALNAPITISAGATFFDEYATEDAFKLSGNVIFDTTGKFEASGTLTLGDSVSITGAVYVDLSQASHGKASLLFYAQAPTQAPLASLYGSVVVTTGGDLNLNGTSQYASSQGNGVLLDNSSFTVEFWAQRADMNRVETVIGQGGDQSGQGFQAGFDAANNFVVTFGGKTLKYAHTDQSWHHWAITFDNTTGTRMLYEDGKAVASDTTSAVQNGGKTLLIGKSGSTYFDGAVDAVRVWNVARSATDIQSNYLNGSVGQPSGLIGSWIFDTGTETTATDLSGNGSPLLISGSPSFSTPTGSTPAPFAKDGGFEIAIHGEVDLTLPSLPGGLDIVGDASFQVDIANASLDLSVSGYADLQPLGRLASLAGNVHFDETGGKPHLYGAAIVESDLAAIPAFQKIGLTTDGPTIAFLRFNTTSTIQNAILTFPGGSPTTYALPADAFSIYINGSIGLHDVFEIDGTLYASFSYATLPNGSTDPEFDVAFNADLQIGPTSASVLTLSAKGILMISGSGLAAQLTIAPKDTSTLAKYGINLSNTSITLAVNTTGKDESFTVPTILDPDGNVSPGSGQTYTVPGAPAIANSPGAVPYLFVSGTADLNVEGFDLNGSFDMLVTAAHSAIPAQFRIDVNSMAFSITVNSTKIISLTAQGGLLLESTGFAGALSVTVPPGSSALSQHEVEIDASFTFEVNTTNAPQSPGGIYIPPETFMLTGKGDLKVGPSGSQFDISATLTITINQTGLALHVDGTAKLGVFGNLATIDDLVITDQGLYGALSLTLAAQPFTDFVLSGKFQLEFNTTNVLQATVSGVSIPEETFELHISGAGTDKNANLQIANVFDVSGYFDLTVNSVGFKLDAHGSLSFMGQDLATGTVVASIYNDGQTELALYAGLTLGAGTSLAGLKFSITASPDLEINTGSTDFATGLTGSDVPATIPAHTVEVALKNAEVDAFGFKLTGSIYATASSGGFDITIPQSDPLSLSFLNLGSVQAYGYINSDGDFSLTGMVSYDVKADIFELYGSIGATISNTGFSAYFSGGASLDLNSYGLGTVNLASASASIDIEGSYVDIKANVAIGKLSFPFHEHLGAAPSVPKGTPGLQFYNVPAIAGAGQEIVMTALDNDSSGSAIADGNYQWFVFKDGAYFTQHASASFDFTLGAPGNYAVSLYQLNAGSPSTLLKQSNITVIEIPPTIPSLGFNAAYPVQVPVPFGSTISAVNYTTLQYAWTVLKNGVFFTSGNTASFTFTPNGYPSGNNNHAVDVYTVTLTIADLYGGSATATGSFVALDPDNITVTSLLDDVVTGQENKNDKNITLREAYDLIYDNHSDSVIPTIHFDPSLAGKTIVLTQTEFFGYSGPGGSGLGLNIPIIIDATDAPGLTIAGAPGGGHRLFYVGPQGGATFRNVILSGGHATGTGSEAWGGAIYDDGSVVMFNSTLINNSAVSTGTDSSHNMGLGGAVYVGGAPGTTFVAYDSTFANNTAQGASGIFGPAGPGIGGAIYDDGALHLQNDTIAHNTVTPGTGSYTYGSGVYAASEFGSSAVIVIYNTIVADNVGANQNFLQFNAAYLEGDGNLITSNYGLSPSNIASTQDPKLGALLPRTDGALTYSLLPGSLALNAGDYGPIHDLIDAGFAALDERNLPRAYNNTVDIGAFEHQPTILVTNANGSGPGSFAEAVNGDDDGTPIVFDATLYGKTITLTSGPLNIHSNLTIIGLGANNLTISGGGLTEIFNVAPGVTATITGLTLANGLAVQGGAIFNSGALTLNQVALLNNKAQGNQTFANAAGGAIYNATNATLTLNSDTFANNAALGWNSPPRSFSVGDGRGGAIYNAVSASISSVDDTFASNLAQAGRGLSLQVGTGGAIDDYGSLTLANSTLALNSVVQYYTEVHGNGTDIVVEFGGGLTLTNSIAANGAGGLDIENLGSYLGQHNLVMSSYGVASGSLSSTADPKLRPLANYGGPTPTLALQASSPAIGQASLGNLPSLDQRGYSRTYQGTADLGAFELQHYIVTNTNDSGIGSLRWAVLSDVDESPITFALNAGSTISLTSGPIVIPHSLSIVGPGASQLTINGSNGQRDFTVSAGTVSITGLTIAGGQASQGGGVFNSGTLTIDGDFFQHDTAQGDQSTGLYGVGSGGAIYNAPGGTLTVTDSTFANDLALGAPGVKYLISDGRNQGDGGVARGGAITNAAGARLILIDDTFTQDDAQGGAGVTWSIPLFNRTYKGNGGAGYGGAIDNAGSATVVNTTFNGNSVKQGAQSPSNISDGTDIVIEPSGSLILYNTIAAKPGPYHDIDNLGTVSGGGNVVMASTGLAAGVVASTSDPLVNGLSNNGGSTQTMALSKSSPVYGLGVLAAAPALDQNGNARIVSGFVDPGAVELQVPLAQPDAGSAYTINFGQSLTLNSSSTSNPANSVLTYSWDIGGKGTFTAASGKTPRLSWSQLQSLGLGVGTTTVEVRVSDGYGGANHTVVSQPVTLTILPAFQLVMVTPSAPGSIQNPFPSVDLAFSDPVDPSTLTQSGFLKLTHNGTSASLPHLTFSTVSGQTGVERLSGLSTLTAEGSYVLTFDGTKLSDFHGVGVGQTSVTWIIDRTAPTSQLAALPASETSTSFVVTATGSDPRPSSGVVTSGVASYDLYVSTDGAAFAYWTTVPASSPSATFNGQGGHSYGFQSFATDVAGNREAKTAAVEAGTYVPNLAKPVTQVTFVDSSTQNFVIAFAGSVGAGNVLDHTDIFVEVNGGSPYLIGKVAAASGAVTYEAIADGTSNTYGFYSIGVDRIGNVEPTPVGPAVGMMVTAAFDAPASNQPIGLMVDHGAAGRSFVGSADLVFDNIAGLANLISNNDVHLVQHALDGTGSTPISPSAYSLAVVDHAIEFSFGANGLGGNPTSTLGDGYYEIDVDGFAPAFYFDRILGDVNGDGTVDTSDVNLVTQFLGSSVPGQAIDVDGRGSITGMDRIVTLRARGHQLAAGLPLNA